jgi:hypothetical protein
MVAARRLDFEDSFDLIGRRGFGSIDQSARAAANIKSGAATTLNRRRVVA